jgi:hypothetical protein
MQYSVHLMPWGKYRGFAISDIPESYLRWVLDNCTGLTPTLRAAIAAILEHSGDLPTSLADAWYRRLAMEFHPDRGGSHEAMKAVNRGRDLLLSLVEGASR